MEEKQAKPGLVFERLDREGNPIKYPAWRYHAMFEPKVVQNTEEDELAYKQGWKDPSVPVTAIQGFSNFYHDLEDMNCRQLAKYAKDEYDADLPEEAGKPKLLWAIWQIASRHPKNNGRVILLAQSIRMNLDETHKEILRMAGDMSKCDEVEVKEIWL